MRTKLNCWQEIDCGREPGGHSADECGVCPATTDVSVDGLNGGINGGRICWAVAGTFCGGVVQSDACKQQSCMACHFFDRVLREEGDDVVMMRPGQDTWVGYRA